MRARLTPFHRSWLLALVAVAIAGCVGDADVASTAAALRGDGCVAGAVRCLDGNTPQLCVAQNGHQTVWVNQTDCGGDTPICSAGHCVCAGGAVDCVGNQARSCVGGAWQVTETCSAPTPICSAGACVCQDDSVECVDANTARKCVGGVWQTFACEIGCLPSTGFCQENTIPEAGVVSCDPASGLTCSGATPICSVASDYSTQSCTAGPPSGTYLSCDGPNDCPAGTECCKGDYALCSTSCVPAGTCTTSPECFTGRPNFTICDPAAPSCNEGIECQRVDWFNPAVPLYGCKCPEASFECVDANTARTCEAGAWQTINCEFGCSNGVCQPDPGFAPVVACDPATGLTCSGATPICSVASDFSTQSCTASPASGMYLTCDDPTDCPAGTECCKGDYALCSTNCVPTGTCTTSPECFEGLPNFTICDPSAPSCPAGTTCQRVDWFNPDVELYGCK